MSPVEDMQVEVLGLVRRLGPEHETTLTARLNLAHARGVAGEPVAALIDSEIVAERCATVLGPTHPVALSAAGVRAHWLGATGDRAGAIAAYEKLLPDALAFLGEDDPTTLSMRLNLTAFRDWTDNPEAACDSATPTSASGGRNSCIVEN